MAQRKLGEAEVEIKALLVDVFLDAPLRMP